MSNHGNHGISDSHNIKRLVEGHAGHNTRKGVLTGLQDVNRVKSFIEPTCHTRRSSANRFFDQVSIVRLRIRQSGSARKRAYPYARDNLLRPSARGRTHPALRQRGWNAANVVSLALA